MPKNAKISVYKEKEFEMYTLWKSIPAYFRGMNKNQLLAHGFSDPMIQKVIKIKSQTEFAKAFNIKDLGTLTDWNNIINNNNLLQKNTDKTLKDQLAIATSKIASQPDILLRNKLREQRQIISFLKKEIALYKKQSEMKAQRKPRVTPPLMSPVEPYTKPVTPDVKSGFLKNFKKYFTKWSK